jgi:hypothetical protein
VPAAFLTSSIEQAMRPEAIKNEPNLFVIDAFLGNGRRRGTAHGGVRRSGGLKFN